MSRSRIAGAWPSLLALSLASGAAQAWEASGTVKSTTGTNLAGVAVSLKDSAGPTATTDASGAFRLSSSSSIWRSGIVAGFSIRPEGPDLLVRLPGEGALRLDLLDLSGRILWGTDAVLAGGQARVSRPVGATFSAAYLRVRRGTDRIIQPVLQDGEAGWRVANHLVAGRSLETNPVLLFSKAGFADTTYSMTGPSQTGIAVAMRELSTGPSDTGFVEDHRSECTIPTLPAVSALTANAALPDPFKMLDGTAVTTKAQWKCRREEIAAMLEKYVHGEKPRKPEKVVGSFSGNTLTITVTDKGKTGSFAVTITKPSSGSAPFAALIGWDGGTIGGYSSLPVAKISYPITKVASEGGGRGKGVFYDIYGSNHPASELMAHAWGLSRIIDALASTPAAGIDPRKIAVTGCSRWGKSSAVAGSFDQRVKLVIPQESGSGGVSAWRIIPSFSDAQPISSTANEAYWTRADFLSNFGNSITKLPVDHHQMVGMIAPNALLVLDNSIAWLGPQVSFGTTQAAKEIFTALGASEAVTYSSVGGHTHCSQPTTQDHWVKSYMQKYLLGGTGEAAKIEAPSEYKFDRAKWINWSTPILK